MDLGIVVESTSRSRSSEYGYIVVRLPQLTVKLPMTPEAFDELSMKFVRGHIQSKAPEAVRCAIQEIVTECMGKALAELP